MHKKERASSIWKEARSFFAVHAHAANADIPPGGPEYKKAGARLLPATGDYP